MDITTAIIAVIILAICALPFLIDLQNRKKKEKVMLQEINKQFATIQAQRGIIDLDSSICYAMDKDKNHFLFLRYSENQFSIQHVQLDSFQKVELHKTYAYSNKGNGHGPIEQLILKFSPLHGLNTQAQSVLLYDATKQTGLGSELQLAVKWVELLNAEVNQTVHSTRTLK